MITAEMISQYLADAKRYGNGHMVDIELEGGHIIFATFCHGADELHLPKPYITIYGDRLEWTVLETASVIKIAMMSNGMKVATVDIYAPTVAGITHYDEEWLCVRGDVS